jgi:acetyltransferase-like isoleucine patch superfamily enzyme
MDGANAVSGMFDQLRTFFRTRRDEVDRQFQRTLPFGDYVSDRWEKAQMLGFGQDTSIYDSAHIFGDVTVGKGTWIGPFTILDGSGGGLSIGDHCSISAGVQIYTHDTVAWANSGGDEAAAQAPTRIGNNCYLGPNVVVAKGVTIGDGAKVGANSLVLHDIPAGATAHGNPARVAPKGDE